jgi:hypothetical protein
VDFDNETFSTLGVQPPLGCNFAAADDRRGAEATLILTCLLRKPNAIS